MKRFLSILALLIAVQYAAPVWADSAWISAGGSAHQLSANETVAMESEVVKVLVHKHLVTVDCQFVFVNNGPGCTVRMGFPDATNMSVRMWRNTLHGTFQTYSFFVDGKKVKSQLVKADEGGYGVTLWHASEVEFPANSTRKVHVVYSHPPGVQGLSDNHDGLKLCSYILHTAASWHGPIKTADIDFTFDKDVVAPPIKAVDMTTISTSNDDENSKWWQTASRSTVAYESSKAPTAEGNTVSFHFDNLTPADDDDIRLYYGYMSKQEAIKFGSLLMIQNLWLQNGPSFTRSKQNAPSH